MRAYSIEDILSKLRDEGIDADEYLYIGEYKLNFESEAISNYVFENRCIQRRQFKLLKNRALIGFNIVKSSKRKFLGYLG